MLISSSDSSLHSLRSEEGKQAARWSAANNSLRRFVTTWSLIVVGLVLSVPVWGQTAPFAFEFIDRPARDTVSGGLPQFEYLPGYFEPPDVDDDYDLDTVFRVEYAVNNNGTRSQIRETSRFQLVEDGPFFLPLVRNIRDGVVREPFDEVVVVRLIDGRLVEDENQNLVPDPELIHLCSTPDDGGDNTSGTSCVDVGNKNKNSFYHGYTEGHRDQGSDTSTACEEAYTEFGLDVPSPLACPIARYQSERVTCFKCIVNNYAINRGSDNIFSKTAGRTRNNIGRVDLIVRDPIVITAAQGEAFNEVDSTAILDNVGFLIMERGGNDNIAAAAITEIRNIDDDILTSTDPSDADLQRFARLLRTYDNLSLEGTLITPGRSAVSLVTQLGTLRRTTETISSNTCLGTFWGSTGESTPSAVFMNSNPADGETGHFIENRPDQDLGGQDICGTFVSLADLGIGIGDEFFGVSLFGADVVGTNDLILLTDIPRDTSAASGVEDAGGLDLLGGGGFFFREDTLLDYGDAPDSYGTVFASDGPRHQIGGPWLPEFVLEVGTIGVSDNDTDAESDGQPSPGADGDDEAGVNDEQGVVLNQVGETTCAGIDVTTLSNVGANAYCAAVRFANPTGLPARLTAWVDFAGNGKFDNACTGPNGNIVLTGDPNVEGCERAQQTVYLGSAGMETMQGLASGQDCTFADSPPGTEFTDGVAPPFCEGVFVLVWEYDEATRIQFTRDTSYARFRISTDSILSTNPSPLGLLADGEVEDHLVNAGALPVSIHAFESRWTSQGLEVTWGTVSETENLGFYIWGYDGDQLELLTSDMIPSEAADAVTPHRYQTVITDPRAREMQSLAVTAVDVFGREEIYGLYRVGSEFGRANVTAAIDWTGVRAEVDETMALHETLGPRATAAQGRVVGADFSVSRPGLHRITYEQLYAAGMDLVGLNPDDLAVTRAGEPVARFVRAKGAIGGSRASAAAALDQFGPGSYIEFWGEKPGYPDALYVEDYVYRVSVAPSKAVDGQTVVQRVMAGPALSHHLGSFKVNEDNGYNMGNVLPDPWHAARLRSDRAGLRNYVTEVSVGETFQVGLDGRLEVVVAGGVNFPVSPAHHVQVFFNDIEVHDVKFEAAQAHHIKADIPASLIQPGENSVRVFLPGGTEAPVDLVFVDTVELFYPREFRMVNGRVLIQEAGAGERVQVAGVPPRSRASVFAWDGIQLMELRSRVHGGLYANFQTLDEAGLQYWVSTSDATLTPGFVGAVHDLDLLDEPADFLVIAHPAFMPLSEVESHPLTQFVQQRISEGWSVRVVDVTDVQQHFGGGMGLPQAITAFLRQASEAFAPSHVLLVGGDSYDYHDRLGKGSLSFIPTVYASTSRIPHTPADGLLADLDGNGVADLAIGRWPVRSLGDLESIVTKTLDWSAGVADLQRAVWVADSEQPGQPSFAGQVDRMLGQLSGAGWNVAGLNRILIDEADDVTAARHQLFGDIEAGATFTGFVGHGSPASWTFQGLVMPNDLAELWNEGSPTLISTSTCYTSYFVSPANDTVAHRWMNGFRLDGENQPIPGASNGAVAIHGASTLSSYSQNEFLVGQTNAKMLEGETLGESIRRSREAAARRGLSDQVTNWILLGDPTLRLSEDPWAGRR